jgi:uncharacterized protein YjdB
LGLPPLFLKKEGRIMKFNNKLRATIWVCMASFSAGVLLVSCGGGGGGGSAANASGGSTAIPTPITGYLSKAPISGATCKLYNAANQVIGTAATSAAGAIDFGTITETGAITAQCTGGTYKDEATGQTATNTLLSSGAVITAGNAIQVIITPLTQLAYTRAGGDPTKMAEQARIVASAFGLGDVNILAIQPTDLNTNVASNNAQGRYGTMLASVAQHMSDQGTKLDDTLINLGKGINTDGTLGSATAQQLQTAVTNLTDPNKNKNSAVINNASAAQSTVMAGLGAASGASNAFSITAANPSTLISGTPAPSNWTLTGTGITNGLDVALNDIVCKSAGTVNAAGTTMSGVDCSNITTAYIATSAKLVLGKNERNAKTSVLTISLNSPPTPNLLFTASPITIALGQSATVTAASASTGAITYASSDTSKATIDSASGLVTPIAVGSVTITATQAAVAGQYTAAIATLALTVLPAPSKTIPVLTFATATQSATLGDADVVSTAAFSCSAESAYAPVMMYSSSAPAKALGSTAILGSFALKAAGSAVITATALTTGSCAEASKSYTLVIGKATPLITFNSPITVTTFGSPPPPSNLATVSAPTNKGSGGALPSVAGLTLSYSSSNPSVATVSPLGALTIISPGNAKITATIAGDSNYKGTLDDPAIAASYNLIVDTKPVPVLTLTSTNQLIVGAGSTNATRTASLAASGGRALPTGSVTYSSAQANVATVNSAGVVTGVVPGYAIITASYAGDSVYSPTSTTYSVSVVKQYSKISNTGVELTDAALLGSNASDWACTRDNVTGLIWEVEQSSTPARYTLDGTPPFNFQTTHEAAVNAAALCGFSNWRLPTKDELVALVIDSNINGVGCINLNYFPNTLCGNINNQQQYWTSSMSTMDGASAWSVRFSYYNANAWTTSTIRTTPLYVRLVRKSP